MRILIIEDNAKIGRSLITGLQSARHTVELCDNGRDGEEAAAATAFDAIILDATLADLDGLTVCRNLRRRRVATPIVLLTVPNESDDGIAGLDAGADDFLTRPFYMSELLARLRALLRRAESPDASMLRYADLTVDRTARRATRGGESVALQAREFALLEYLMRRPDRVLTRSEIGEGVWSQDYGPASNVIDVYVCALRKKLQNHGQVQLIHTVKNAGFRFGVAS